MGTSKRHPSTTTGDVGTTMTTFLTILLIIIFGFFGIASLTASNTIETALWGIAVAILWAALII